MFQAQSPSDALNATESASITHLVECRRQLLTDGLVTDVKSEAGYAACTAFLSAIDAAARAVSLRPAQRDYRSKFTANYRALFPDGNRHYRADVLEACVDQQFDIWVNGQKFELDATAIERGQALQAAWISLISSLDLWPNLCRADISSALSSFDESWAAFEQKYISALIAIEAQARCLIVSAVELENQLPADPATVVTGEAAEAERGFVDIIAKLNSIANYKGKGRDDLRCDVLEKARAALGQPRCRGRRAAEALARDVIASYGAMRAYMRKAVTCLEQVDPHLCNNAGLVARLIDYEESWEVGARYVSDVPLLDALCDVCAELETAQKLAPELGTMIEDCDVELFMVLPRLVMLGYLASPHGERAALVRKLLPHRFGPVAGGAGAYRADEELQALCARFQETARALSPAHASAAPGRAAASANAALVRRAVLGQQAAEAAEAKKSGGAGAAAAEEDAAAAANASPEARRSVRELLLAVETWSLELQRHCPEDWNQCSAVLVHCLSSGEPKDAADNFQV